MRVVVGPAASRRAAVGVFPLRAAPAFGRSAAGSAVRHYTAPMQEMKFLLNDVYDVDSHYKSLKMEGAESATPEMIDMILLEMAKFSENTLAPLNWASAPAQQRQHRHCAAAQ